MVLVALVVLAVVLAWPVPRMMARLTGFRRAPRAALVVWQSAAVAAVLAALFTAPVALVELLGSDVSTAQHLTPIITAAVVTGLVAGRLLISGHLVGTRLRAGRRRHRDLVDLLAVEPTTYGVAPAHRNVRVIEHPTPTAYCVPGLHRRVVLTQGTLDALPPDELDAVLSHERAHLSARHDLVLEFFSVVHEAVPRSVRSDAGLREVNLLIEVLADRAAVRTSGAVATGRAIVHMASASSTTPAGALAMSSTPSAARVRLDLLAPATTTVSGLPPRIAAAGMYAFAVALVAMPVALLVLAIATH